jgi:hypothetical protein
LLWTTALATTGLLAHYFSELRIGGQSLLQLQQTAHITAASTRHTATTGTLRHHPT